MFKGNYRGFEIYVSNALKPPSADTEGWPILAGSSVAIAAPRRSVRSYIVAPGQGANRKEVYEFLHVVDYGYQLINSRSIVRGLVGSGKAIS